MRGKGIGRALGVQRLDTQKDQVVLAGHVAGQKGGGVHHLLKDRAVDAQACGIDRGDMGGHVVDKGNVMPGADEGRAKGAADGTGTPDQNLMFQDQGPCITARVSATAISQITCISASGRS